MERFELTLINFQNASEFGRERSQVGIPLLPAESPPLPRLVRAWRRERAKEKGKRALKWLGVVMIVKEPVVGQPTVLVDTQSGLSIATSRIERVISSDGRTLVETRNSIYGLVALP